MVTAAVWLGSDEARVLRCGGADPGNKKIEADAPRTVHPRNHPIKSGKVRDNREYFEAILAELTEVEAWTVAGPDTLAREFEKYVRHGHAEELGRRLVAVEAMDRPDNEKLAERARSLV